MRTITSFAFYLLVSLSVFAQKESFKRRFVNHTEFGGLFGRVKYNNGGTDSRVDSKFNLTIETFNGLQLNPRFSVGAVVGLDWYKTALITPIAAGIRYDLTHKGPARLYVSGDVGYGFTWLNQDSDGYRTKGGLMLNPGIGLKYGKPGNAAFTIGISYKRQAAIVQKPLLWEQVQRTEDRVYNRMALKLGMTF